MTDLELAIVRFDGNVNEPYADLIVESLKLRIPKRIKLEPHSSYCPTCDGSIREIEDSNYSMWCGQALKLW